MTSRRGSRRSATRFNYDEKVGRLKDLEAQMGESDFWNSQERAKKIVAELKSLKAQVEPLRDVVARFEDAKVGYQMSREAGDKDLLKEADEQLFQLQAKKIGRASCRER